jgi:hypothetical protein
VLIHRRAASRTNKLNEPAQVCPVAPTLARNALRGGRAHNVAGVRLPTADHWGVDAWALALPTPIETMW